MTVSDDVLCVVEFSSTWSNGGGQIHVHRDRVVVHVEDDYYSGELSPEAAQQLFEGLGRMVGREAPAVLTIRRFHRYSDAVHELAPEVDRAARERMDKP